MAFLLIYRVAILCSHVIATIVCENLDVTQVHDQRAYDLKLFSKRFFTGWNVGFQILFLLVALLNSTMHHKVFKSLISPRVKQNTHRLQGYMFTCLVAPSTIFVVCMFWTLWTIDRELVLSEVLDAVVPSWLNHALHTVIIIPVVVELLFCKMHLPHHKDALTVLATVNIAYTAVLIGTYFEYGRWIYDIFKVLPWPGKFALCILSFLLMVAAYFIGYKFQQIRWNSNIGQQIKLHTKQLQSMINF